MANGRPTRAIRAAKVLLAVLALLPLFNILVLTGGAVWSARHRRNREQRLCVESGAGGEDMDLPCAFCRQPCDLARPGRRV
ncbi:hypothetical protein ACFL6C_06375 [Myxococcota bacterium]